MPIQIYLSGGEYQGPRRFAVPTPDDKSEPKLTDVTPKLTIETSRFPSNFGLDVYHPERIPKPTFPIVDIADLRQPTGRRSSLPYGVDVRLKILASGFVLLKPDQTAPSLPLEMGSLGEFR